MVLKLSPENRRGKKIFYQMQEMFLDRIEPDVIHLVLTECDWKEEESIETLLSMCQDTAVNAERCKNITEPDLALIACSLIDEETENIVTSNENITQNSDSVWDIEPALVKDCDKEIKTKGDNSHVVEEVVVPASPDVSEEIESRTFQSYMTMYENFFQNYSGDGGKLHPVNDASFQSETADSVDNTLLKNDRDSDLLLLSSGTSITGVNDCLPKQINTLTTGATHTSSAGILDNFQVADSENKSMCFTDKGSVDLCAVGIDGTTDVIRMSSDNPKETVMEKGLNMTKPETTYDDVSFQACFPTTGAAHGAESDEVVGPGSQKDQECDSFNIGKYTESRQDRNVAAEMPTVEKGISSFNEYSDISDGDDTQSDTDEKVSSTLTYPSLSPYAHVFVPKCVPLCSLSPANQTTDVTGNSWSPPSPVFFTPKGPRVGGQSMRPRPPHHGQPKFFTSQDNKSPYYASSPPLQSFPEPLTQNVHGHFHNKKNSFPSVSQEVSSCSQGSTSYSSSSQQIMYSQAAGKRPLNTPPMKQPIVSLKKIEKSIISLKKQKEKIQKYIDNGLFVVIILRGLPGSGKSKLAQELQLNGTILSTDDYFMNSGVYEYDVSQLSEAHVWNKIRARTSMERKFNPIIIDNTNTMIWEMKPYVKMAMLYNYEVEIMEPSTPWKFKPKELAKRNSHGVSKEVIMKMNLRYDHGVTTNIIIAQIEAEDQCRETKAEELNSQKMQRTSDKTIGHSKLNDCNHSSESQGACSTQKREGKVKRTMVQPSFIPPVPGNSVRVEEIENVKTLFTRVPKMSSPLKKHRRRHRSKNKPNPQNSAKEEVMQMIEENLQSDTKSREEELEALVYMSPINNDEKTEILEWLKLRLNKLQHKHNRSRRIVSSDEEDDKRILQEITDERTNSSGGAENVETPSTVAPLSNPTHFHSSNENQGVRIEKLLNNPSVYNSTSFHEGLKIKDSQIVELRSHGATEVPDLTNSLSFIKTVNRDVIKKSKIKAFSNSNNLNAAGVLHTHQQGISDIHDLSKISDSSETVWFEEGNDCESPKPRRERRRRNSTKSESEEKNTRLYIDETKEIEKSQTADEHLLAEIEYWCNQSSLKPVSGSSKVDSVDHLELNTWDEPKPKPQRQKESTADFCRFEDRKINCPDEFSADTTIVKDDSNFGKNKEPKIVNVHVENTSVEKECEQQNMSANASQEFQSENENVGPKETDSSGSLSVVESPNSEVTAYPNEKDILREMKTEDNSQPNSSSVKKKKKPSKRKMAAKLPFLNKQEKEKFQTESWSSLGINSDANVSSRVRNGNQNTRSFKKSVSQRNHWSLTKHEDFNFIYELNKGTNLSDIKNSDSYKILLGKIRSINVETTVMRKSFESCNVDVYNHDVLMLHKGTMTVDLDEISEPNVEFLQNSFPAVGEDQLREALSLCQNNVEWTINLLLDWGVSVPLTPVDKKEIADEMFKLKQDSTLEKGSADNNGSSDTRFNKSPLSLFDLCRVHVQTEKLVNMEEMQQQLIKTGRERLQRMESHGLERMRSISRDDSMGLEDSAQIDNEDLIESSIEVNSATNLNSDQTDFVFHYEPSSISYEHVTGYSDQSDKGAVALGCKEDNSVDPTGDGLVIDHSIPESDGHIVLPIPAEFVRRLQQLFGPVESSVSGQLDEYEVSLDLKTAVRIHANIRRKVGEGHLEKQLRDDEAIARRLQAQEEYSSNLRQEKLAAEQHGIASLSKSSHPIVGVTVTDVSSKRKVAHAEKSLMDIMEEEEVKQQKREAQQRILEASGHHIAISTKLKRQKLYHLFPGIDEGFLEDIFQANGYSLEDTINVIHGTVGQKRLPKTLMKDMASELYEKQQSLQDVVDDSWQHLTNQKSQEVPTYSSGLPDYEELRSEANLHHQLRTECFQKAQEAFRRGMKDVASFYSQQGHLHTQKLKEANMRASEWILETRNVELEKQNILDLHGYHISEALAILQRVIKAREKEYSEPNKKRPSLSIITGRGKHSLGGVAKLRPAIIGYLQTMQYGFTEVTPGLLKIQLKYSP